MLIKKISNLRKGSFDYKLYIAEPDPIISAFEKEIK